MLTLGVSEPLVQLVLVGDMSMGEVLPDLTVGGVLLGELLSSPIWKAGTLKQALVRLCLQ